MNPGVNWAELSEVFLAFAALLELRSSDVGPPDVTDLSVSGADHLRPFSLRSGL